ncbi:MAG: tetratricopeptide repeat protein [Saprospiraceae bacterium]|nr:tetratricopeptide repeat protein [Bacteroidia bacterium]NNL93584.1 tetratricopeptide repeat protein [Saprospiraceae bacterium]
MRRVGNYDNARNLISKAHSQCEVKDYNSLGRIFHVYRQIESDNDNFKEALKFNLKSLDYYKRAKNENKIAHSTRHIADLLYHLGHFLASEKNYKEAISIYKHIPKASDLDLANTYRGMSLTLEKGGKIDEAVLAWKETKKLYSKCGLHQGVDEANNHLELLI